ncbi:hypothetical protein GQ53DRAFT_663811 [Thozetella sp. PMI_491]|nr:hypothetical protein GQ53DRAFT_663811 [Thozetella sp. PMI_491]
MALANLEDVPSMSALGRTCKAFYSMMMPRVYGRIAVAAMFHAHIPKLIRTVEPLLTIAQKKQLKREGKYRGQQERYPTGLDEQAKPFCTSCVRQLVVGVADPGKKHKYIVVRYVEELLKNLDNLEILETRILTKSIAESLAARKSLKALNLFTKMPDNEDVTALSQIKNLKHLSIHDTDWGFSTPSKILQSIIKNSASSLESLTVPAGETAAAPEKKAIFQALKSLDLTFYHAESDAIRAMVSAIDFTQLNELAIGNCHSDNSLLFRHLAGLNDSSSTGTSRMKLRHLCLTMDDGSPSRLTPEERREHLEAKCRFISSFDTLETLQLEDYGQYPENASITNPGLVDVVLQAILCHRGLRVLRISYRGKMSGYAIPYLSAATVGAIVDGLPQLREFQFAPDEVQMDEIGRVLSRGTSLSSITCFPHTSWGSYPPPTDPGSNILSGILNGFLNHPEFSVDSSLFVWERRYNLAKISTSYRKWEVASQFPDKSTKGMKQPEQIKSEDGKRQVWSRDVTGMDRVRIHVGYDPDFEWVEKVSGQ